MYFAEIIQSVMVNVRDADGEEAEVSLTKGEEYPAPRIHDDYVVLRTGAGEIPLSRCYVRLRGVDIPS